MANIKFKRILVPLFVLIAMMFTTMGLTGLTAKAATAEEDLLLCYSNNRNVVKVIDEVEHSGLRGRGGGGFPTGRKWAFAKASQDDQKYVCCNADEGDPGAVRQGKPG